MSAPKGHKVVTVERQGGYAARCTVVVDGVETLCDATFACDTRTEAREAIRHEDAPGAAPTATEGEITTKRGSDMHDITQDPELRRGNAGVTAWARSYADSLAGVRARVRAHADWPAAMADAAAAGLSEESIVDAVVAKWKWTPPTFPRELWPSWATECVVNEATAYESMIWFRRASHGERDSVTAFSVECIHTIVVSDHGDLVIGDYFEGEPFLWSSALGDSLNVEQAVAMSSNLAAATAEFVKISSAAS